MPLFSLPSFLAEKSDQLSTKFVRSCTEIGLSPLDMELKDDREPTENKRKSS